MGDDYIIKARGLPWSASAKELMDFLKDCSIQGDEKGIHFTMNMEGRPSGEAFVELASQADLDKALGHNNDYMGKRYIEVQAAKRTEMEWMINRAGGGATNPGVATEFLRLRGLPYDASKTDIAKFFSGIQIAPYGITLTMDQDGNPTGDAYVEFVSTEEAENAMSKHKQKIGHRYIELFKSSKDDVKHVVPSAANFSFERPMGVRPTPYDRPSGFGGPPRARGRGAMNLGPSGFNSANFAASRNPRVMAGGMRGGRGGAMGGMNDKPRMQGSTTGHSVHMRGLPFEATVADVCAFFAPLNPTEVRLLYEDSGRAKGECDVDFLTHADAESAMGKNKQHMGHRYIELFLRSSEDSFGWSGGANKMLPGNRNPGGMMGAGGPSDMGFAGNGYNPGSGNSFGGNSNTADPWRNSDPNYSSFTENVSYPNIPQSTGGGHFY